MSTRPRQFNGKSNIGFVSDEITELPGTVSANGDNGTTLEETTNSEVIDQRIDISLPTTFKEIRSDYLGMFKYTPSWCRKLFLSPAGLLFFLSWGSTIQGMLVNGFVNVAITSLERRFDLKSTQSGFIASSYDMGSLLAVVPISYFGGLIDTSKPRYIALGLLCMGTGSLVFSLPHFIADPYFTLDEVSKLSNNNSSSKDLCFDDSTAKEEIRSKLTHYRWFFYIGQFLNGVGATPLTTLATPLLDDTVTKTSAPIYIGIFQTFFVVGPAIGYILGGSFLGIYVDFKMWTVDIPLKTSGQTWVGAWWIGFIICWIMSWLCAFAIFCYPALLQNNAPSSNNNQSSHRINDYSNGPLKDKKDKHDKQIKKSTNVLIDILLSILSLLRNPTYLFISIGEAFDALSITGLSTFLPKFVEQQYGYTAGTAALLFGIIVTPSGGLGTFSGGFIIKYFKLNRNHALKMYIICQTLTMPMCLSLLLYCPSPQRPGISIPYEYIFQQTPTPTPSQEQSKKLSIQPNELSLSSSCNEVCGNCGKLDDFMPVCGSDNLQYFNPCYAGCKEAMNINGNNKYFNCSCVDGSVKTTTVDSCNDGCDYFPYLSIITFVIILFTFMSQMPGIVATLRFVRPEERSLGNGIQSIVIRLLGAIPGPILYGRLIDEACLLSSGNCLFYDNYSMSAYLTAVSIAAKVCSISFYIAAVFSSRWCTIPEIKDSVDQKTTRTQAHRRFSSAGRLIR